MLGEQKLSSVAANSIMEQYPVLAEHPLISDNWNYESGCMLKAFSLVYERTNDERYLRYVQHNMDAYVQADGTIRTYRLEDYNLDQINAGKVLLFLHRHTKEKKYWLAAERLFAQLQGHPRTDEGSFWHKKIYPYQVWLDGLYMAMPFLTEYAKLSGKHELWDDAAAQLVAAERLTRNAATGLLHHAYDENREQEWAHPEHGRSPHAWGRAVGWYSMALVDVLDDLPLQHPKRGLLIGLYERLTAALVRVQDSKSGLWHQVLDQGVRTGNYVESSCSAMIVYAMMKALNRGYISESYREAAMKGFQGLATHAVEIDESGHLHLKGINRVAGLGGTPYRDGSFTYYVSEAVVTDDPKGVAPFIMACLEREVL